MVTIQKWIVIVPEDVTFLVSLVHHIGIDEALVDLVLALSHSTDRLHLGFLEHYVFEFVI